MSGKDWLALLALVVLAAAFLVLALDGPGTMPPAH
jgi:hypothetical protein